VSTPVQPLPVRAFTRQFDFAVDPVPLFRLLTRDGQRPHSLMLESADPTSRRPSRTFLVPASALCVTCQGQQITFDALEAGGEVLLRHLRGASVVRTHGKATVPCPRPVSEGTDRDRLQAPSALSPLRDLMRSLRPERSDLPESVFLAGLMAYDLIDRFESLPEPQGHATRLVPDYQMYLASQLVIIDHVTQRTEVIAVTFDGDVTAGFAALAALAEAVQQMEHAPCASVLAEQDVLAGGDASVDCSDAEFAALVQRCQRHIGVGDVFQIVPSRTFTLPCPDALRAYEHLRHSNPSPYLFYLNAGAFTLFGSSPESAIRVNGPARTVTVTPIAGTRPRGFAADGRVEPDLDVRLEAELRLDPKETAEHMMLVDLARNDIARVSTPGSRVVTELMQVERSSRVMHLVSRVEGRLANGLDALQACQAIMNPGTLTGAPKLRAMELLRQYESTPRGHYGGMIGYLQADGTLDTAIVIRAALVVDGMAQVRAGAGVVYDSVPELEAAETRQKAGAVLQAIAQANLTAAGAMSVDTSSQRTAGEVFHD
jgi:anthranilate synthase component 1